MSQARPVFSKQSLLLTRRTARRRMALRPDPPVVRVIEYVLAATMKWYQLELSAFTALSNHHHGVAFDLEGVVPDFNRDFHSFTARLINSYFGESGSLWSRGAPGVTNLLDRDKVIDEMGYVGVNVVAAGLVRDPEDWPGPWHVWSMTEPKTIKRPDWFFRDEVDSTRWPEEVTLEMSRPSGFDHLSDEELAKKIRKSYEDQLEQARKEMRAAGRRYLGRARILRTSRESRARSPEQPGTINPKFACSDPELRKRAREWWREFGSAYRNRLKSWGDDRESEFPFGTYQMRVLHGVNIRAGCPPGVDAEG